ncbi:reverse transcriptase domain-containing protein [Tanacetum coccineum]
MQKYPSKRWQSILKNGIMEHPGQEVLKLLMDLAAIQVQLNNLGREIKKVNEKVYAAQVGYRTVKYPNGIGENVLVGIGKFVFPIDFIILDMPEDVKVPLILKKPFLSTAHAKIDVFRRKITLRAGDEKIIFKSMKPASSLIKKVYMLGLREQLRIQVDDLRPTIEEGEVIDEPMIGIIKTRNNESFDEEFYNSIMKDKVKYKGKNVVGAFMNVPIFVRKFSIVTHFVVEEIMDGYRDQDMGDVIVGEPFCKASCVEARRFDGLITIHNVIMEYLVKISKKACILELKRRNINITVLTTYTLYLSRKIRRIYACTSQETTKIQRPIRRIQEDSIRRIQFKDSTYLGLRKKSRLSLKNDMEPRDKLEEEKARRHGKEYNWETAKYGRLWNDDDEHDLRWSQAYDDLEIVYFSFGIAYCEGDGRGWIGLLSMDQAIANVPYMLAQYLFRHAEGREIGARMLGGHFIGRLAAHFGMVSNDEVELLDEESSDSDNEDEVAKIFRIDTNVFDFEAPTYRAFKEFNYLLQIDPDVLTKNIDGFKTYEEYKDDWIYEWNKDIPRVHEKPWTDNGIWEEPTPVEHYCEPFSFKSGHMEWTTCNWKDEGYCNEGHLLGAYIVGNTLRYQDLEWYEGLEDGKLKDEALKNKAIMDGIIDKDDESHNKGWRRWDGYKNAIHDHEERKNKEEHGNEERCELFDNPHQKTPHVPRNLSYDERRVDGNKSQVKGS